MHFDYMNIVIKFTAIVHEQSKNRGNRINCNRDEHYSSVV